MMKKLLSKEQAEAVANAMAAINNVCGTVTIEVESETVDDAIVRVFPYRSVTRVALVRGHMLVTKEDYPTQADFLAAYGIG